MGTMGSSALFPPPLSVLLVEHDRTCLLELGRLLSLCNYSVTCCRDANEAQSSIQSNEEAFFDIVLCEVHLPGMSGVDLLEILVHKTDIPVVMISSDLAYDVVRRAITLGARDYLAKPVLMHSLKHLWRHLQGKDKWRNYILKYGTSELGRKVVKEEEEEEIIGTSRFPKTIIKVKEEKMDADVNDCYTRHPSSFLRSAGTVQIKEELIDGDEEEEERRRRRGSTVSSRRKTRMTWTPELHQMFVSAVNQLGDNAFPRNILRVMGAPDLTSRQVASHLQAYRRTLKKEESSRVAEMSRPGLAPHQPHPSNAAGVYDRERSIPTIDLDGYTMGSFCSLMHQSIHDTNASGSSRVAEMSRPGLAPHQPHPSNAAGVYDRERSIPTIDLDGYKMGSFCSLMHQSIHDTNASGSSQAGMNPPFMYPNHSKAISSQYNTQTPANVPIDQSSNAAGGYHREKIIPIIDLDSDGTDSSLMHQSLTSPPLIHDTKASGSFTYRNKYHDSGKRVEGSFYQDNQMNHCVAIQDHLIPAQYVNDGVLTHTDTNLRPSVGSGRGEATMDSDNNSGLTTKALPLDQSSHVTNDHKVGTSQSMATNFYDEDWDEFRETLSNLWYD